nr:TlpA disulfide reductase family protein [uncultured Draconibacterium sp.]
MIRKIITLQIIPVLLSAIILGSCAEKQHDKKNTTLTVITGNVKNLNVYPNTKEFTLNIVDFRGKKTTFSDSIKSDGTFRFVFDLYKPQDISIAPIVGQIIAHPGDSIHIGIDFADIGNIQFSGDRQKSNTGLNKFLNSKYYVLGFKNRETNRMELSEFRLFCDSVKSLADNKQREFVKEFKPTHEVNAWTKDYVTIAYQKALLHFPFHYGNIRNLKSFKELDVPDDYYSFLENISTDFSDSIVNTAIYQLLGSYSSNYALRTIQDTTLSVQEYYQELAKNLINEHSDGFFRQMLIGNLFYQKLNQNDPVFFTTNKKLLEENVQEPSLRIPLNNYYSNLEKQINNPEINSNATLSKLTGTAGESLIDSIFAKNEGKVIYIDFWATWCGPCRAEMPNSKKLKEKLAGEDIEFVYICIDSDEKQWKLALSQMQLDGQHYYCNKEQSRNIWKAFEINGIPHYMLINKKGHIIEAGSYLRPMNPQTISKIKTLL